MTLDFTSFNNAIVRLREGLVRYDSDTTDMQIRDGLIQRFEFTYEIAHKMLKRYLEISGPTPEIYDEMSFSELIRSGNEQGLLLGAWPEWRMYRMMRAKTSHTYDEMLALEVVAQIPQFLRESEYLLAHLQARSL